MSSFCEDKYHPRSVFFPALAPDRDGWLWYRWLDYTRCISLQKLNYWCRKRKWFSDIQPTSSCKIFLLLMADDQRSSFLLNCVVSTTLIREGHLYMAVWTRSVFLKAVKLKFSLSHCKGEQKISSHSLSLVICEALRMYWTEVAPKNVVYLDFCFYLRVKE